MQKFLSLAMVLVLIAALNAGGCASPAYYAQAIGGHYQLMRHRQDVDEAIRSGSLAPETARQLQLASKIRAFASTDLGLPDNGSFRQFVHTGREAVTWNVVAAEEFSLEPKQWCFPVAGCVSYRGYFKPEDAHAFAGKLSRKGLDTDVSPAIAYSTLGWFDDPLLDTMLAYDDEQLAGIVFHELAHQQLYIKDDTAFNEAYARFVEQAGVLAWLGHRDEPEREQAWRASEQASLDFNRLLSEARTDLQALYETAEPIDEKRRLKAQRFERLGRDYASLVESHWSGRDYYAAWFSRDLNNARLALIASYEGGSCAFDRLFEEAGADFIQFHELARQVSRLSRDQRTAWLDQPC